MIDPALDEISKAVVLRKGTFSKDCPWCNGKEYQHNSTYLCLHREILDFTRWILPSEKEKHLRFLVIKRFQVAIKQLWPNAKVICHGSTATGTFLPNGDLDFCVVGLPEVNELDLLEELNDHLRNLQIVAKSTVISAKCPIIKGVEKPFGFHFDISVNNENGILNIRRNLAYFKKYPSLVPMLMVLKIFLYQEKLDEPFKGGISSNTLIQLCIFIIQASKTDGSMNLGRLIGSFFSIFGRNFNYFTCGISTREDGTLFSRIDANRLNFKSPVTLCVEDPQLIGNFLGENAFATPEFRAACNEACNKLYRSSEAEQSIILRFLKFPGVLVAIRSELLKQYDSLQGTPVEGFKLSIGRRDDRKDDDRRFDRDDRRFDRDDRRFDRDDRKFYDRRNDRDDRRNDRRFDRDDRPRNFGNRNNGNGRSYFKMDFDDIDGFNRNGRNQKNRH